MKLSALYMHIRNIHETEKHYGYHCLDCKLEFKHNATLRKHLKTSGHQLQLLRKQFTRESAGKENETVNLPELQAPAQPEKKVKAKEQCKCQHCGKQISKSGLARHIDSVHLKIAKVHCNKCEKKFKRTDQLQRHIKDVHKRTHVICNYCNKRIESRNFKERHKRLCENNQKLYNYPGNSKWERYISKFLVDNNIGFQREVRYPDLVDKVCLPFDFLIPNRNILIEIHGLQHWEPMSYDKSEEKFESQQKHDAMKREYARMNGIAYLEIDTRVANSYDKIFDILSSSLNVQNPVNLDRPLIQLVPANK